MAHQYPHPMRHLHEHNLTIERRLGDAVRARLPGVFGEFVMFVFKQAWACLFGGLLLVMIVATKYLWNPEWALQRYDFLFLFAIATQALFLRFKLETWEEARVILLFHLTGTAMEWFKVHAGSWAYPEPGFFKLLGVPLFSGFMYASVGSYMARVIRIFSMQFAPYPPFWTTVMLAVAIYVNFFAHHFLPDIRLVLFAATLILYARTRVWFVNTERSRWMPLPLAAFLSSLALWVAENVGTATGTWLYSGQLQGQTVSFAKLGSWYLLLYVAFVTVTLVSRSALSRAPLQMVKETRARSTRTEPAPPPQRG
ncbi:DUF817 domain-containing protein [Pseudorhodobacter sp.]|uniref:DUF817 domain-containing protein n=1 Tax=Pseudorhodobacter sp. TaxID=1934400 RepID=UPI002648AC5F|nr:DUF817 domain-containing protein [Pseudorhodobacter sp.]MDN5786271.1 DUF817 domain-containing protein [Pseudorhodobacter sp.]